MPEEVYQPDEWAYTLEHDYDDYTVDAAGNYVIVDLSAPTETLQAPASSIDTVGEITRFLDAVFEPDDLVNVVMTSYNKGGKWSPQGNGVSRTADQLREALAACGGDIGRVLGDYKKEAGAWVRINPVDASGSIADYRYCLIESDALPIDDQYRILQALELPIASLVHSGGSSLHAIVRVDAADRKQYDERVRSIVKACADNGLAVDTANKSPSRLTRLPGVQRGEQHQYIVATRIGRADFLDWQAWMGEQSEGLPDATSFDEEYDQELASPDVLIDGVLAAGEKLLLAAQSKAGKSFALLELCVAMAEGLPWMGLQCTQGDVLYINLELKADTRKKRLKDIYEALGIQPANAHRIHCMDLRGRTVDLQRLTAKLVGLAVTSECKLIILDPIYKLLKGDENSSADVSAFCNAMDYLVERLGVSVVYCHHYSKGGSNYTSSMNRASGSSVFSRDADALVTMDEVELTDNIRSVRFDKAGAELVCKRLDAMAAAGWRERLEDPGDTGYLPALRKILLTELGYGSPAANALIEELQALEKACMESLTGWRVEGTLRDFPRLAPFEVWYQWPLHVVDRSGILKDASATESRKQPGKKKSSDWKEKKAKEDAKSLLTAYEVLSSASDGGTVRTGQMATYLDISKSTLIDRITRIGVLTRDENGYIQLASEEESE